MSQQAPYALPFTYSTPQQQQQYPTLNNNIMMVAVVLLFAVIFFILAIHIYAKWFWRRSFFVRVSTGTGQARAPAPHGLDKSVIDSLPMFVYNKKSVGHGGTDPDMDMADPVLECPVCLSEFQENEKGRQIPSCKHRFHVECIDMWLFSHSTCPLCRTEVLLDPSPDGRSHGSLDTKPNPNPNPHPGGLPPENENENVSTNSHGHISLDIPSRELDMAASCASDAGQSDPSAKSPGLRNSFKRIMGRQSSRVSAAAEISGNDA